MNSAVLFFLGILMLPRAAELLAPFLLGLVIYFVCRRSVRRMAALGLNRTAAVFFALAFAAVVTLSLAALLCAYVYGEGERLPELVERLSAVGRTGTLAGRLISAFGGELTDAARTLAVAALSRLKALPEALMTLVFGLLAAFFFLRDEEKIVDIIVRLGGDGFVKNLLRAREAVAAALGGYVRAQLVLMAVTFGLLAVFFLLFGVEHALLAALAVAALDAVPVFGVGFVLLPWALFEFLTGAAPLALGLLGLYAACSLTRQILEPRLVSSRIGLHPLLTLAGIYAGFRLFGVLGLIIGPVLVLIFVSYIQKRS